VKSFLRERGVPFAEKDVMADEQAFQELEAKGFFATPVTMIDGQAVVGFNRARLEALLHSEEA
jgi:glutaredoxin-like protein NrdH